MRAVILAAGRGARLAAAIGNRPKCLAPLGRATLVERQIATLHACGVDRVTVVAGYRAAHVERVCAGRATVLCNAAFSCTNSIHSLWLARDLLLDGFVVLNGDVLFHPQMLSDLLTARREDALLVASRGDGGVYTDEEMKVHIRRGLVMEIAKTLPDADSDAENVGIAKFGREGARALVDHVNRIVSLGGVNEWLPRAFADFAKTRALHAIDSRGYPWIEIDYPEDYWRACGEILPAIDGVDARETRDGRRRLRQPRSADIGEAASHV
jgi:choline kinase